MSRISHVQAGATLLELVIALALLGLASGAILGLVGVANRSSLITQEFQELQHNVRTAAERISEEVRWGGAPLDAPGGFVETEPTAVAVTIPPDPEYPACERRCRPYPEADPGRAYAVRFVFDLKSRTIRRQVDATGQFDDRGWVPGVWTPRDGLAVADHIADVRFEYFDRDGVPTTSPSAAHSLRMRVETRLGRYSRFLVSEAFLRQK